LWESDIGALCCGLKGINAELIMANCWFKYWKLNEICRDWICDFLNSFCRFWFFFKILFCLILQKWMPKFFSHPLKNFALYLNFLYPLKIFHALLIFFTPFQVNFLNNSSFQFFIQIFPRLLSTHSLNFPLNITLNFLELNRKFSRWQQSDYSSGDFFLV
jgi:hypothetical protein